MKRVQSSLKAPKAEAAISKPIDKVPHNVGVNPLLLVTMRFSIAPTPPNHSRHCTDKRRVALHVAE